LRPRGTNCSLTDGQGVSQAKVNGKGGPKQGFPRFDKHHVPHKSDGGEGEIKLESGSNTHTHNSNFYQAFVWRNRNRRKQLSEASAKIFLAERI
jgi:hypothetical protein